MNGVGKSSFTGSLKYRKNDLGIIVDVDKLTAEQFEGDEYEGGKAAIAKIEKCLESGVNFTQETPLSGSYPRKVAQAAKEKGYFIRMFYVGINTLQESLKRIQNCVELGGHDIPQDDVERRFERRFSSLKNILPYCNEAVFFDNRNGFKEVAEYRNGEIIPYAGEQPRWLSELVKNLNEP